MRLSNLPLTALAVKCRNYKKKSISCVMRLRNIPHNLLNQISASVGRCVRQQVAHVRLIAKE